MFTLVDFYRVPWQLSPQKTLATPLLKTEKNDVKFLKNYFKRREKPDLNLEIYGTKSVLKTNIYQKQKWHSNVAFDLMNTSLGMTCISDDTIPTFQTFCH